MYSRNVCYAYEGANQIEKKREFLLHLIPFRMPMAIVNFIKTKETRTFD